MAYHDYQNNNNFKPKEFDIDTHCRNSSDWECVFYHKNIEQARTRADGCKTQKEASDEIVNKILALPKAHQPVDMNTIVWNSVSYFQTTETNSNFGKSYSTYSHCDHDPLDKKNVVFEINGVKIIGATKSKIEPVEKGKKGHKRLIINCSGSDLGPFVSAFDSEKNGKNPITKVPTSLKESMFATNYFLAPPPPPNYGDEVCLDWGDQKAAPVRTEFWADLLNWIRSGAAILDEKSGKPFAMPFPYTELVFCCIGGHGRTGTAIASLAIAAGIFDAKKLVDKNKNEIPDSETTLTEKAIAYVRHIYCKSAVESNAQIEYLERVEAELRTDGKTPVVVQEPTLH